jgi:hypothetical protein
LRCNSIVECILSMCEVLHENSASKTLTLFKFIVSMLALLAYYVTFWMTMKVSNEIWDILKGMQVRLQ